VLNPAVWRAPTSAPENSHATRTVGASAPQRRISLSFGDINDDLAVDANLSQLLRTLPTATRNPLMATNLRELQSPLKTLAGTLSMNSKFIVDCGGQGQCGPNTLGYLLGLVGSATVDGPQLRQAVVQHALAPAHRSRCTRFRDNQDRFYTLEGLILRCLADDLGHSPGALMHTVEAWCHNIAKPASWTDLAFLQVAADCYRVAIYIHTVDDLSTVGDLGVILPCDSVPVALLEVGMWIGRHLVAVVTSDLAASAAAQQPMSHHPPSLDLDEVRQFRGAGGLSLGCRPPTGGSPWGGCSKCGSPSRLAGGSSRTIRLTSPSTGTR